MPWILNVCSAISRDADVDAFQLVLVLLHCLWKIPYGNKLHVFVDTEYVFCFGYGQKWILILPYKIILQVGPEQ